MNRNDPGNQFDRQSSFNQGRNTQNSYDQGKKDYNQGKSNGFQNRTQTQNNFSYQKKGNTFDERKGLACFDEKKAFDTTSVASEDVRSDCERGKEIIEKSEFNLNVPYEVILSCNLIYF